MRSTWPSLKVKLTPLAPPAATEGWNVSMRSATGPLPGVGRQPRFCRVRVELLHPHTDTGELVARLHVDDEDPHRPGGQQQLGVQGHERGAVDRGGNAVLKNREKVVSGRARRHGRI